MSFSVDHRCGSDPVLLWLSIGLSCRSNSARSLGTSICCRCSPKKEEKKKEEGTFRQVGDTEKHVVSRKPREVYTQGRRGRSSAEGIGHKQVVGVRGGGDERRAVVEG